MPTSHLYDLADQLYVLEPWNWMMESQLIYLRHPETNELGYISIMGQVGAHLCLALYIGTEALHRFNLIHDEQRDEVQESDTLALILESRQLQISFNTRPELLASDLATIKRLNRKYRGNNWPMFRSFHPGCNPDSLSESDAVWMTHAIEQLLHVAPLLKDDPFGDRREAEVGTKTLTREQINGVWQSTWTRSDNALYEFPTPAPEPLLATKVAEHPTGPHIECDFPLVPQALKGDDKKLYYPYIAISVEPHQGFILGLEMLTMQKQSLEVMKASAPNLFLRQWDKHNFRPASISVSTQTSYALLLKTAEALKIPLHLRPNLLALRMALTNTIGPF
jgi:hypothetical protein